MGEICNTHIYIHPHPEHIKCALGSKAIWVFMGIKYNRSQKPAGELKRELRVERIMRSRPREPQCGKYTD